MSKRTTVRMVWVALALVALVGLAAISTALSTFLTCGSVAEFDVMAALFTSTGAAICGPSHTATWVIFILSVVLVTGIVLTVLRRRMNHQSR
ncbi:glucan phosphoethanolaminetransferase (alkaline phosphatase superfamily) [Microbacterium phyllosphaerae]|uniref:Glucan phosphoethanolaminetransferase (Alkaline phosphatase superfamily) n=1 Tax=Microbacterium phyllosphaerae TaxID=124798 RepID=A0ABS4WKX9_9MICO|nr:glucan phosphoethanolaminetransferase (alkaline phosphatase superfamily) [Microbacterium phyllosphaerae]